MNAKDMFEEESTKFSNWVSLLHTDVQGKAFSGFSNIYSACIIASAVNDLKDEVKELKK